MFRLTAVLLAGIYATLVIWGDRPQGDVAVTRAGTTSPAIPVMGAAVASDDPAPEQDDLSDLTPREAVQAALKAGETQAAPAEPAAPPAVSGEAAAPEEQADLWHVTGTRVNLRSGPSTNAAVVGGISLGDRAQVLSDPGASWVRIRTEQGLEAWIYGRFLSETPA